MVRSNRRLVRNNSRSIDEYFIDKLESAELKFSSERWFWIKLSGISVLLNIALIYFQFFAERVSL